MNEFIYPDVLENFLQVCESRVGEKTEYVEIKQRLDGVESPSEEKMVKKRFHLQISKLTNRKSL